MLQEISKEVWAHNYQAPGETSVNETWKRQAVTAASIEKEEVRKSVEDDFYWLLSDFKGIAGGRITANLGVEGREGTTLMNCFVFNPGDVGYKDPDSINGIYDMLKAQALTLKSEGGYGMNFSWIRPAGMYVRGIDSRTPGVIQMMSLWNQSSSVITMGSDKILGEIQSTEKKKIRKGAQMGILEIWHPEIESFIDAKLIQGQLNKFNISVGITEGFMEAVINDADWELKFPDTSHPEYSNVWSGNITDWESRGLPVTVYAVVKARDLWDKIMKATYTRNDPGVLFLDLVNKLNALSYSEHIATTNPCVTGDTKVATDKGVMTIQEVDSYLSNNDKLSVLSYNINTGVSEYKNIYESACTRINADIIQIELDDGTILKLTPDHLVYTTNRGYVQAHTLTDSDNMVLDTW